MWQPEPGSEDYGRLRSEMSVNGIDVSGGNRLLIIPIGMADKYLSNTSRDLGHRW